MKGPLIFLDIDGVLNTHDFNPLAKSNTIDRDKIDHLNMIILVTDARIVLSSAWRYHYHRNEMTIAGLDWLLRAFGLAAGPDEHTPRVCGVTPADTMMDGKPKPDERGEQITRWRYEQLHCGPYVVIDDGGIDPETRLWTGIGIDTAGHPVVWTDSAVGLRRVEAEKAIAILRGEA